MALFERALEVLLNPGRFASEGSGWAPPTEVVSEALRGLAELQASQNLVEAAGLTINRALSLDPEASREFTADLRAAAQIARLPPDRLLQRGWWEYSAMIVGLGGRDASDSEKLAATRMVDYVQSEIVSVKKPFMYFASVSTR